MQRVDAQVLYLHQIVLERPNEQIMPAKNAQLSIDRIQVPFNAVGGDVQIIGDFLILLAGHDA